MKPCILSHFSKLKNPSYSCSAMWPEYPKIGWPRLACWLCSCNKQHRGKESGAMNTCLTWLYFTLVWSQENYHRLLKTIHYFDNFWGYCPHDTPEWKSKAGVKKDCIPMRQGWPTCLQLRSSWKFLDNSQSTGQ